MSYTSTNSSPDYQQSCKYDGIFAIYTSYNHPTELLATLDYHINFLPINWKADYSCYTRTTIHLHASITNTTHSTSYHKWMSQTPWSYINSAKNSKIINQQLNFNGIHLHNHCINTLFSTIKAHANLDIIVYLLDLQTLLNQAYHIVRDDASH